MGGGTGGGADVGVPGGVVESAIAATVADSSSILDDYLKINFGCHTS